jgi:hypothetical protein
MAAGKDKKANPKSTDIHFRSAVRNRVVLMADDTSKDERDVPWSLLIAVIALCFVLVIALPVMGIMYMDMNNATIAAMEELRKMRELRIKMMMEMQDR